MSDPLGLFSKPDDPLGLFKPESLVEKQDASAYKKYVADVRARNSRVSIPGAEAYDAAPPVSKEEFTKRRDQKMINTVKGVGEAAASFATFPLAYINALGATGLKALLGQKPDFEKQLSESVLTPGTDEGQRMLEAIGTPLQALPPVGGYVGSLGAISRRKGASKPVPGLRERLETTTPVEAPKVPEIAVPELRLESPVAADIRVAQQNRKMPKAEDYNNRDANANAVQEEIAAFEAARKQDEALAEQERYAQSVEQLQQMNELNPDGTYKHQRIIDDTPHGDVPAQFGSTLEHGRIDENGMPIRADLSMEAQNLQNPLQRNLWGDELGPAQDQVLSLTEALDSVPAGAARDAAVGQLSGQGIGFKGQRGAIAFGDFVNLFPKFKTSKVQYPLYHGTNQAFSELKGTTDGGALGNGTYLAVRPEYANGYAEGKGGNVHQVYADIKNPLIIDGPGDPVINGLVSLGMTKEKAAKIVEKAYDEKGYVTNELRSRAKAAGYDGIVQHRNGIPSEIVAFSSDQVKSAIAPVNKTAGLGFKGQRGGVLLPKALEDFGEKLRNSISPYNPNEKLPMRLAGDSYIPKGLPPADIIAKALAEGKDGPPMIQSMQSGLGLAGEKAGSSLMTNVARHIAWGEKTGIKAEREMVQPLERLMGKLSSTELKDLLDVNVVAQKTKTPVTEAQLRQAGASEKVIQAHNALKKVQADLLETLNASREKLGFKPIKGEQAYFASMWQGDYHVPVKGADGKLTGYIKTTTRSEALKAIAWVKKNQPDAVVPNTPEFKSSGSTRSMPRDVGEVYTLMQEMFQDTPFAQHITDMAEAFKQEQAFNKGAFPNHFKRKSGVDFFLGDRPWLDAKENAAQGINAQMQYLKEGYRWAPMQEAMASLKEVLSNPDITAQQPNNMALTKAYVGQSYGLTNNIFKAAESAVAQALGVSAGSLGTTVAGLKTLTYLQQLGLSGGYAIATPLQAFVIGPAEHVRLTSEGKKYNTLKAMTQSMIDTAKILGEHAMQEGFGKTSPLKLSATGTEALRYLEDNGIINANLWDEYATIGENRAVAGLKNTVGLSISVPEKIARVSTFMSFVHHLTADGTPPSLELFRQAEELTNNTLTNFHRTARPLLVDKLGLPGELLYTYKSPMFNYYNNLGKYAGDFQNGNPKPLLALLGMTALTGGALNMPGASEINQGMEFLREQITQHKPEWYKYVKDLSLKEFMLKNAPDVATYGVLSTALGTQLHSRFSTEMMDFGDLAPPVASTIGSLGAAAELPFNPSATQATQATYDLMPSAVKGNMEGSMDAFRAGKQGDRSLFYTPGKLGEAQVSISRNADEELLRRLGLYSLTEAKTKDTRFQATKGDKLASEARKKSMSKLWNSVARGTGDVETYARAYLEANGDQASFERDFTSAMLGGTMTPEQRQMIKAKSLAAIMSLKNRLELMGQ
jgi:ADP-Ribosyltransferase in polyvalent proteins